MIATLLPRYGPMRGRSLKARALDITINIISGLRSYEEQDALYAQGRTAPGNKVTNARGGYSNHNFGIAFDIGVFSGNRYLPDSPKYKAVASSTSRTSNCVRPGRETSEERDMLAELRRRRLGGEDPNA